MTPLEQQVWAAVYAVAWFQPTARVEPGAVTDGERAFFAAGQAVRAVAAMRSRPEEIAILQDPGAVVPWQPTGEGSR